MPSPESETGPGTSRAPIPWSRPEIVEALLEAGEIARDARSDLGIELKEDASLVTRADREIEAMLVRRLEDLEADVRIIGEETILNRSESYVREALTHTAYIIDPIDGTAPYSHGMPHWGISIGRLERGRLTEGAVYLPQMEQGEILISEGDRVQWGRASSEREGASGWEWTELAPPRKEFHPGTLICISQDQAKRGSTTLPNPVQVLGSAVYAIAGVLTSRFVGYTGSLKLWDIAGCLPLIERLGLAAETYRGEEPGPLGLEVPGENRYLVDPAHPFYWGVRGGLIVARPELVATLREAFEI